MQLYSRSVIMAGPPAKTRSFAANISAYVSEKLGNEMGLWAAILGAPAGSMTFASRVEGLATIADYTATLSADEQYLSMLEEGSEYIVAPPEDRLLQPIYGALASDPAPLGAIANVTSAIASIGFSDAVTFGVELAQLVESITGTTIIFASNQAGNIGEFVWLSVVPDAATADSLNASLAENADYIAKLDAGSEVFIPGASNRVISIRTA